MRRFFLLLLVISAALVVVSFFQFASKVRGPDNRPEPARADAIVALTGGSLERLSTGVRLLENGKGERLLISGVNRVVTDNELFTALDAPEPLAACCIDLGRFAQDTLGNAAETAAWVEDYGYKRIILVTDDYHMPRSYAELSLAMPGVEIEQYPVRTKWTDPTIWRNDIAAARRLGSEYLKLLTFRSREALLALSDKSVPEADQAEAP